MISPGRLSWQGGFKFYMKVEYPGYQKQRLNTDNHYLNEDKEFK